MTCIVKNCKGKVIGRYSPDMDIRGIGYCLKHKTVVAGAYMNLIHGDREWMDELSGNKD
jgi:hypothetical protein